MANKAITMTVGNDELKFNVSLADYNRYQNEVNASDKVAPSMRFLRRTLADPEQRELLDALCDQGLALQMAMTLMGEFVPEVEIAIKK